MMSRAAAARPGLDLMAESVERAFLDLLNAHQGAIRRVARLYAVRAVNVATKLHRTKAKLQSIIARMEAP